MERACMLARERVVQRLMSMKGVDSILYTGANYWPGEQPPSARFVELANHLNAMIEDDHLSERDAALVKELVGIVREPSQEMRGLYFQAYVLRELYGRDFRQAYAFFSQALDIAEIQNDLDSQLVLADQQALMLYGLGKNHNALEHYQVALEIWQERKQQLAAPSVEPELYLLNWISVLQRAIGEFESAAGTLARVLTVAEQQLGATPSLSLRLTTAGARWTLGLIHRAQSDQQDGSETLLLRALMRFHQALINFREVSQHEMTFGRLWIQVAETYLDLSDYCLQHSLHARAKQARKKALAYIRLVQGATPLAPDPAGKLMTDLALLRWQITRPLDASAIRKKNAFDKRLRIIEMATRTEKLPTVAGKVAMLRGEWRLWLGDAPHARSALFLALANLHANDTGEMPRVMRLLRRSNAEAHVQRIRRPRATGPRIRHPRKGPDVL